MLLKSLHLIGRTFHHALAFALALFFVLPLFWILTGSLRQTGLAPPRTIEWFPETFHPENYATIFELIPLAKFAGNSLLVVAFAVPITIIVASWAGLAMAQMPNRRERQWFVFSIIVLMIPASAVWLFRFQLMRWMGLLGSLPSLVVPAFAGSSPLFILLFYWSFRRITPAEFESALLDGADALTIWWHIAMPQAWGTMGAVFVLAFVMYWSDFINPILYLRFQDSYTLPLGLQIIKQMDATNWPLLMAAAVVMTVPVVIVFALANRTFMREISLTRLAE